MPLLPYVRRELYLQAIKNRVASALPDPNNREELFLKAIAEETALIPSGVSVVLPAEVSEMLANLPEAHTHTERFYRDIIDAILVATIVTDTTPYLIRDTANHAPITPPARLKKKLGNTVAVNQLAKELNTTNWITSDGSISSGEAYIQPTSTWKGIGSNYDPGIVVGHKYLVMITGRLATSGTNVTIGTQRFGTTNIGTLTSTSNQFLVGIFEQASADVYTTISFSNRVGVANFYLKDPKIIDLTLWFGSNDRIPSDLLSHPENWGRYYAGSLDYNAGTLESADGTVLKSIGRNVWDEEWENGYYDTDTGAPVAYAGRIRSKNPIYVIPSAEMYCYSKDNSRIAILGYDGTGNYIGLLRDNVNGSFSVPSNCSYIRFYASSTYGGTYKNDITISLYYSGESGYDQYYPYSVLAEVDTGSEVLRGVEGSRDEKLPNGTITRNRAVVDMGTIDYTYESSYSRFTPALTDIPNIKIPNHATATTGINPRFRAVSSDEGWASRGGSENIFCVDPTGYVRFYSTQYSSAAAFKTAMSGVYFEYPLATPTTEQGTAFDPVYGVEYGGTESWTNLKGIPQGHETEYKEYTT